MVGRIFVEKDNRRSAACFLEIEPDFILCNGMGHSSFLPLLLFWRFFARKERVTRKRFAPENRS
jgi:hypothetical protein